MVMAQNERAQESLSLRGFCSGTTVSLKEMSATMATHWGTFGVCVGSSCPVLVRCVTGPGESLLKAGAETMATLLLHRNVLLGFTSLGGDGPNLVYCACVNMLTLGWCYS